MGNTQIHKRTLYSVKDQTKRTNEWTTERQQQQQQNKCWKRLVLCACCVYLSDFCVYVVAVAFFRFHTGFILNFIVSIGVLTFVKKRTNALGQTKHEIQIYCCCAVQCIALSFSDRPSFLIAHSLRSFRLRIFFLHSAQHTSIYCQCFIFAHFVFANRKTRSVGTTEDWLRMRGNRKRERETHRERERKQKRWWIISSVSIILYPQF